MYFDSHAHLCSSRFHKDREEVLANVQAAKVTGVMEVGCDLISSEKAVKLAEEHPYIYASVGSHPDDAGKFGVIELQRYEQLASHPKVRAIGEIGLDYFYEDVPREVQQDTFSRQMDLAKRLNMPVIIHQRDAFEDTLKILKEFPTVCGIFHCYSGSVEQTKVLLNLGWCFGFTGVVTFKNARKSVEVAQMLPIDRILIETDCPYMCPEPHRGKRCDSSFVPYVAAKIAEIRGVSVEDIAQATSDNARRIYGI